MKIKNFHFTKDICNIKLLLLTTLEKKSKFKKEKIYIANSNLKMSSHWTKLLIKKYKTVFMLFVLHRKKNYFFYQNVVFVLLPEIHTFSGTIIVIKYVREHHMIRHPINFL